MKLTISIDLDNDAFRGSNGPSDAAVIMETTRVLARDRIGVHLGRCLNLTRSAVPGTSAATCSERLMDRNGNTVGTLTLER